VAELYAGRGEGERESNSTENVEEPIMEKHPAVSSSNFLWTNRFTKRKVKNMKMDGLQNKPSIDY
jgi:hypothetical protein